MKKEKREKDRYTVVLEDIDSKIDLLAEGMSRVHNRLDKVETKIDDLSDDVFVIKETIKIIRGDLKQKIDYDEFESLEKRVSILEDRGKK